jgi:hypothetical protein
MEVDAVGSIHGRATQSPADVWAAKLAEKLDQMRNTVSSPTTSANMTTSASYSPAIFANAASYQVYTQAGALAALSSGVGAPHVSKVIQEHPDDIQAVDAVEGSTVSTLA